MSTKELLDEKIGELLDEYGDNSHKILTAETSPEERDYLRGRNDEIMEELEASIRKEVVAEERQFIINILDGIDIADKEMGVIGGTKAIRFALQSRV